MSRIPTRDEILEWISAHPTQTSKRDIAKAFGIKGAARIDLKRVLRELEEDGHLEKRRKTYRDPETLAPVSVLEISGSNDDGELLARPLEWQGEGPTPVVLMLPRASDPALGAGDRILARVSQVREDHHSYEGRLIRLIGQSLRKALGIFRATAEGGRIVPIDKGSDREWRVDSREVNGAKDGELVEAEQSGPKDRLGLPRARIVNRLGDPSAPKAVSLIAIHQHGIPDEFPEAVVEEASSMASAPLGPRVDLRSQPFVTIDPSDARDHDDACWAHGDDDPGNPGGHIIWVAIADVAHYVRPGSELDKEALKRGNSTYFPDRVVPMLPDLLSGDVCSLHEGIERPCIVVRMRISEDGEKLDQLFQRAVIQSKASLNYEEVQDARDGRPNERTIPLMENVIEPIYAAYAALARARERRQPLNLDLPERSIELDASGRVQSVRLRERLDAHRLIEEFMVFANVAAAEELRKRKSPLLYRVHEEPAREKLEALRDIAQGAGLAFAKGQVLQTRHLNNLLKQAANTDNDELINLATLRSMTQAYYAPENMGHFGLALSSYSHFTSPIRRYADLVIHRALVAAMGWGEDGLGAEEAERLSKTAQHISETERRSMAAERDTTDRYLAAYLSERIGTEVSGRISGIARFGAFVKLDDSAADGLIPIRSIGREYFHFDRDSQTLMGADTGLEISIGQRVLVRLVEATPVTGGLMLELLELDERKLPSPARQGAMRKGSRMGGKRKVTRRRR